MNEERRTDEAREDPKASGDASDHEADPAENPGPRGNQDIDRERVGGDEEDLDRTGAN